MENIEILISEIQEIRLQWKEEVGRGGRRQWPRAIRDRVLRLIDAGGSMREISSRTSIPYETVCQWKYQRARKANSFHALSVVSGPEPALLNAGTVTVTNCPSPQDRPITIRTSDGFSVETWSERSATLVLSALRSGGGA